MQVDFKCPGCDRQGRVETLPFESGLTCSECGWGRSARPGDLQDEQPGRCRVCGCNDLWRQKDFPQAVGLGMVGLGALLSTIAWAYYQPEVAIGVLLVFALVDLILFTIMPDVLVCYRCQARFKRVRLDEQPPRFDLEIAERYRQEAARLGKPGSAAEAPRA